MNNKQCLKEDSLTGYLEGQLDPAIRVATEQHLVGCDDCRSQLAFYMRILDDDVLKEEDSAVEEALSHWTRRVLPTRATKKASGTGRWFAAAAAVLVALTVGIFFDGGGIDIDPESLVRDYLGENRPFESRLSDQQFLRFILTRSIPESEVEAVQPDFERLRAGDYFTGLFYLTQKRFGLAIDHLERAASETPTDTAVRNDLGVAYLESGGGTPEERAANLGRAEEEFLLALELDESFLPAMFNRIVLADIKGNPDQAEILSYSYLAMDPESDWADEVRNRLERLN